MPAGDHAVGDRTGAGSCSPACCRASRRPPWRPEAGDYRVPRFSLLMGRGGTPYAQFWRLTYTQMRDRLLGTGQVTPEELDRLDALFDDPEFIWMDAVLMTVLGRRPIG